MKTMFFGLMCLILTIPCSADIIYVKEGGTGSGTSWADPNGLLQWAINNANNNDEVWVAAGIYKPTIEVGGSGDRYKTFQMKNGVGIYGGFPDTGDPNRTNRNPKMYETILSGDIGSLGDNSDNCYHVFYHPDDLSIDPNAVLDGFTITAGNAKEFFGGGMYNDDSNPTVTGCTFSGNSAQRGGGMSPVSPT